MKDSKTFLQIIFVAIGLAITAGCSTQKTWVYHANSYPTPIATTGKKVAVLPFDDARTNLNQNLAMLGLLPPFPYGWQHLDAPEGINSHICSGMWVNFKPSEDFPKALASDLKNTGLFSDSFFSYQREGSDYAVEGKVLSTRYDGYMITYCAGIYGVYLWLVGLPAGVTENQLSLEMSLVNSSTDKPLFSKTYTATPRKNTSWIYYMKSDFNYAEMLQEVNLEFCHDIQPIVLNAAKETSQTADANPPAKTP